MDNDFLKELKLLGVTARLKRLSDNFSSNIKQLYLDNGIDIEPSWHLLFLILKKNKQMTMSEIASSLQMSQPAVTKLIGRMNQKGYITIAEDKADSRKKILQLSKKAKTKLPKLELIWAAGSDSIKDILDSNSSFLDSLDDIENKIEAKSFKNRSMEHLKNQK